MKRDGNLCKNYLNLEGCCFLNGSMCCNPFSVEGCDIQCREIFYRNPPTEHKHYESSNTSEVTSKREIQNALGIKKNDTIGEWIIPYDEMESMNLDPCVMINEAKEQVKKKFSDAEVMMDFIRVFHNVEILNGTYGVYVIGVSKN